MRYALHSSFCRLWIHGAIRSKVLPRSRRQRLTVHVLFRPTAIEKMIPSRSLPARVSGCAALWFAVCSMSAAEPGAPADTRSDLPLNPPLFYHGSLGVSGTPAVGRDGTLYVGAFDGRLYAIDQSGQVRWSFRTWSEIYSSPSLDEQENVYFGSRDRNFYAVSSKGRLKWRFPTKGWVDTSPAITGSGTVYFGSWDRHLYAVLSNGTSNWSFETGGGIVSSPAIGRDGTIYFGSHDGKFYALTTGGRKKWEFATGKEIISSPAIGNQGELYFTSCDGKFYALNPDGSRKWDVWTGGVTASSPIIGLEGNLYVGVNSNVVCLSPEGKKLWEFPTRGWIHATPALTGDGSLFVGSNDAHLYHVDATGKAQGFHQVNWAVTAAPVVFEGAVFQFTVFSQGTKRFKGALPVANSPWPVFKSNQRHTGVAP